MEILGVGLDKSSLVDVCFLFVKHKVKLHVQFCVQVLFINERVGDILHLGLIFV